MISRKSMGLYFHTIRHLRPVQIWGRLVFRLRTPKPDFRAAPKLRQRASDWCEPVAGRQSQVTETSFRFLNEEHDIATAADWNSPEFEKLWLYNLHYFADLNARDAISRRNWHHRMASRWIAENPPGFGVGWEPYPISLRLVNWVKWCLAGNEPDEAFLHSLAIQLRFLSGRLETHLLGNHLLANAKALIFGGLYFEGSEAERWLAQGGAIFEHQMDEQILPDGGHFERSPMYHALMLEDVLDLLNLFSAYARPVNGRTLAIMRKMFRWLDVMTHPDGGIAFFNDAALDVAPSAQDLAAYASRLGFDIAKAGHAKAELLPDSGYARIDTGRMVMLADVGKLGPDYLPGHAHAGTLSFELSLDGRRIIVNSGTSMYGTGPERQRQRGTAAHNTLRLDDSDSSEVWAGFRVARRARVRDVRCDSETVSAVHDGYARLTGKPLHHRKWRTGSEGIEVQDLVTGSERHTAEVFFHFHPDVRPDLKRNDLCELRLQDERDRKVLLVHLDPAMDWRIEPSSWHPGFGVTVPNFKLVGVYRGELPFTTTVRLVC